MEEIKIKDKMKKPGYNTWPVVDDFDDSFLKTACMMASVFIAGIYIGVLLTTNIFLP